LDFLTPTALPEDRANARALLFGRDSYMEAVCKILGIDVNAARLTLLAWKAEGRRGDPIFEYMTKENSYEAVMRGELAPVPTFERLRELFNGSSRRHNPSS
jgi:hypothetical protein